MAAHEQPISLLRGAQQVGGGRDIHEKTGASPIEEINAPTRQQRRKTCSFCPSMAELMRRGSLCARRSRRGAPWLVRRLRGERCLRRPWEQGSPETAIQCGKPTQRKQEDTTRGKRTSGRRADIENAGARRARHTDGAMHCWVPLHNARERTASACWPTKIRQLQRCALRPLGLWRLPNKTP